MAHDVFISHSSLDKPAADAACAVLEAAGIRCWMAPRDILPGQNWGEAILRAIKASKVMVLVFSDHANRSPHVEREIERAVNQRLTIVTLRIEDVLPTDAMEYFLSTPHWLDAFSPPMERHLLRLTEILKSTLAIVTSTPNSLEPRIDKKALAEPVRSTRRAKLPGASDFKQGEAYYYGHGVPNDYDRAAELYRRAADSGNSNAAFNLARLCEAGNGVPKDYSKAAAWYQEAADLGDDTAASELARLKSSGKIHN